MLMNTLSQELRQNLYGILAPENPSITSFEELVEVIKKNY